MPATSWQPSLLGQADEPGCDPGFDGASRRFLSAGAWLEVVPGWVSGADVLFERLLAAGRWRHHDRRMYDKVVAEPRLSTGRWARPPSPCTSRSMPIPVIVLG